jgi:hypothetical protein
VKLGIAAFRRVRSGAHREDWLRIGRSLNALQHAAMAAAGTTEPIGTRYNECHRHYARKLHATDMLIGLDKPTKAHAMWLARNWPTIEVWLIKLTEDRRNKLNNPTTIRRHFDKDTTTKSDLEKLTETPSLSVRHALLQNENLELQVENADLRKFNSTFLPAGMSMEEVARAIAAEHTPDQLRGLVSALQAILDDPWHDDLPHPSEPDAVERSI